MTGFEVERLDGARRFMELHCRPSRGPRRRELWWVTVNGGSTRQLIADVQKRVTRLQKALGLRPYNATVFEGGGGLHAHIVFVGNDEIAVRLRRSAAFGTSIAVEPVTDAAGLTTGYLVKERTPQAGYRRWHRLGGRLGGSHRLDGGGDRVRLSRDLERDAVEASFVEPWQHTNARRKQHRPPYWPRTTPMRCSTRSSLRLEGEGGGRGSVVIEGARLPGEECRRTITISAIVETAH